MGQGRRLVIASSGRTPGLRAGAVALFVAGCVPMLVMLPAGVVGALDAVGIASEAGWVQALSRPLAPVAQPLLIVSTLLLGVGSLRCGWLPVASALGGGALLYLGMYVVTAPGGRSHPAMFYAGLLLFLASPVLTVWRPRVRACRPLLGGPAARIALLAALGAGAILLASAPAVGWGRATAGLHARHLEDGRVQGESGGPASPVVRVQEGSFLWSGSVDRFTDRDAWFPSITSAGAVLDIDGRIKAGSLFVQLMDGRAAIVYEQTLTAIPTGGIRTRVPGSSGVWMVTLGFQGYSGELELRVSASG